MKSRHWSAWVAIAALAVVSLAAAPAGAANFTFTFDGCDGDTVCVTPVLGGTPDSIQWFYSGATYIGSDVATPFDTCFIYAGSTSAGGDSVVMKAFFTPDPDTTRSKFIIADYINPVDDGHTIDENDSVLVNVLVNDTLFFVTVDSVVHLNPTEDGPFHGTVRRVDSVNSFWYVPDEGYNGTDIFAYRIWRCDGLSEILTDTAVVAITIESDGLLSIDTCYYTWGDVPCGACDDNLPDGTISVGDTMQVWAKIAQWDLDELTAAWPKVDLPGLAGTNLTMVMNPVDSTEFCWPGWEADSTSSWWEVTAGNLDVAAGFYEIVTKARSKVSPYEISTCTSIIEEAVDTKIPVDGMGAPDWYLWSDVNGDGIATTLDTMRFYIDLRNEPFGEICGVYVRVYDFPSIDDTTTYNLYEIAGDNRWARIQKVPAGDLDNSDGPYTAWFIFTDNACNVDSVSTTYDDEIDNSSPLCAGIEWMYEGLIDLDSNNCYSLGESLRIRVFDTVNTDDVTYFIDLFSDTLWRFGLGVDDPADSSHVRVPLVDLGGGWWGVDWMLDLYPLANAIDTASIADVVPWVYLHAFDDAENPLTCDSLKLTWTDDNPNVYKIDARPPEPVTITSVRTDTTWNGSREDIICFTGWSPDAAHFRLFWDAGTGVIDYTDTLAGLDMDELDTALSSDTLCWSTDGTVDLSWCRTYIYTVWTIDECGNLQVVHTDSVVAPGTTPTHVAPLVCESLDSNVIGLTWRATDFSIDSFYVFYGRDYDIDYDNPADVIPFVDTGMYSWTTDDPDPALVLEEGGHYWFMVWTKDTCGNWEATHPDSTNCHADMAPAEVCVFQPDTISCYSTDLSVFVCNKTEGDKDVVSVTARGRLADTSVAADTVPGPWVTLGSATDPAGAECFNVTLAGLDALVGADTIKTVELVFTTVDKVGKVLTDSAAYVACVFTFDWSTQVPVGEIVMVDSTLRTYQPYCGFDGWEVAGPGHTIDVSVVGGVPPYIIEVRADDDEDTGNNDELVYVEGVYAVDTTFTFDATGWSKGGATLTVYWTDWCGTTTSDEVDLCVPDEIAPCAEITNPVDGKCIRRSRSTQDPVPLWVTVNPDDNCLDYEDVMKIDFQWADCCGDVGPPTITRTMDSMAIDCPEGPGSGVPDCDTFWIGGIPGGLWDSVNCIDTTTSAICWQYFWVTDTIPDTCEWTTIAIVDQAHIAAAKVELDGSTYWTTSWWNTEDLAWVTESGTIIYIRAIVWDYNNNSYTTECVQVCVDIDTPPLCIWSPDICYNGDVPSIAGTIDVIASLNLDSANIDDLENVTLWYKQSREADRIENWTNYGSGSRATNASEWRWSFPTSGLVDGIGYDFRVIAQTVWGTYSYDYNGDLQFDSETFDTAGCDMVTWFVDWTAPQVAFDTVWTFVNDQEIVQPNVGCSLSDPRGWVWSQYGQSIRVQPAIYPLADLGDVVKIQWTLYDGDCATCACAAGTAADVDHGSFGLDTCDHKVLKILEGTDVVQQVILDPLMAPFVEVQNGYQKHVLRVQVWDACGNMSSDCVNWYMLDIDPTEAIVIDPINDEVFCQDHLADYGGGIEITAATLLDEYIKKAIFFYRAVGTTTWYPIDSVEAGGTGTTGNLAVVWYPHAMGLTEGAYELVVVAEDYSLNRSEIKEDYITTVWLDCATPVVTLDEPTAGMWMGCDFDLRATATSTVNNPIDSVVFFYQSITSGTPVRIGLDQYTADGSTFGYHWHPPLIDGRYYMFARAWNRSGIMAQSDMVEVKFDGVAPWARVIEVNGDVNGGDDLNPTVVTAGDAVPIYVVGRDNLATWGMGAIDNCGVDSVIMYVSSGGDTTGTKVWGALMTPVPDVDSLYSATFSTAGWTSGTYTVWAKVFDCGCNMSVSNTWALRVKGVEPAGTIAVDEAVDCCGYPTVDGVQALDINVTPAANADIDSIVIWRCLESSSDVYDQYVRVGKLGVVDDDGVWRPTVDFDPSGWTEGLYRLRAAIYDGSTTSEDANANGKFDDFTFDANLPHHMWLSVGRTVTDFTVSHVATLKAGTDLTVTVTPDDACDVAEVCYGVMTIDDVYAEHGCGGLSYSLDPVDSGLVSLEHGIWHGYLHADVYDCVSNVVESLTELWILDVATTQAMVVTPAWGAAITSDSYTLTARKLSSATIDSVVFYYGAALPGTRIAKGTKSGDEFTATWNTTSVADGSTYVWAKAFVGTSGDANPPKIHVLVAKAPTHIVLKSPVPSFTRTIWGEQIVFVGERVDLCVDRDSISSILTVGIDSVVFGYRAGAAPGNLPMDLDPAEGWVRIATDRYGSLCVDWFTDSTLLEEPGCTDGRVAVAAWVYDKAGNVNHSNILHVMIDNTEPYSEIHDVDGDETFGDCHVIADANTAVKISGVAIDDRSCAGDDLATNSGAKYLQFFVGECGAGGISGCVDVVWVIDGSGSMADDQAAIANNASLFFNALSGVDFRLGVAAFTDVANPVNTNGVFITGGAGVGQFTTDQSVFQTMVTAVGDSGSSSENGLTALNNALDWYPWRSNCNKVLILVTDEDADDIGGFDTLYASLLTSGAIIQTVINPADSAGYSELAPQTNGQMFDITGSWGANLAAIATQIRAIVSGAGSDAGIIWGQQVTLTDGQTDAFAYWDPSGLPDGEYCAWTVAIDQIGNSYTSQQVQLCLRDEVPPVGWVAGFGETYDCPTNPCVTDYMIYAQTCDADVAMAQVQRRPEGSTSATAWTTMGIGIMVGIDSTLWRFDWNPCLLGDANYEMRVIMTDENGNSWLNIGDAARAAHPEWTPPVLHVDLDGACGVAMATTSVAQSAVGFEDKTFDNLGLVNVDDQVLGNGIDKQHWMLGVYADMYAGLATEKVLLWQDYSNSAHFMGSFDDASILDGGTGKFWLAYNSYGTGATTYLTKGDLMVYHVEPDLGFPGCVADDNIGATVCINPGALSAENGVVLFPARFPIHSLTQLHFQAWPNIYGTATAIRLTSPLESGFNTGKYATITISYDEAAVAAADLTNDDLTIAWWDGDKWNTTDCMIAGGEIANGTATFYTCNLSGIYAIVSAGAQCNSGALTVAHIGQKKGFDSWTGPKPTIYTLVKSNIEGENNNRDIDPNATTVVLDRGTANELVLWANGKNPSYGYYTTSWDSVSGILATSWNAAAPPLSEGAHTLWVRAFNKSGYCKAYTWSFNVDATEPDVAVTGDELCQNPVFTVTITDNGAGVDWDSVYVDVYDITGSEFAVVPASRLIHTETPDAFQPMADPNTFSFELVMHTAQERRLHIVVYDGTRSSVYDEDCDCEYYVYQHDIHGVPDKVGNHTEVVEEIYVVSGPCGVASDDPTITLAEGSLSPFDPWSDGSVCFALNGFTGSGVVTATVYDLAGKVVQIIHHDAISGQSANVCWSGDTKEGGIVAEGVYLIHFQAQGGQGAPLSQVVKLPVMRTD